MWCILVFLVCLLKPSKECINRTQAFQIACFICVDVCIISDLDPCNQCLVLWITDKDTFWQDTYVVYETHPHNILVSIKGTMSQHFGTPSPTWFCLFFYSMRTAYLKIEQVQTSHGHTFFLLRWRPVCVSVHSFTDLRQQLVQLFKRGLTDVHYKRYSLTHCGMTTIRPDKTLKRTKNRHVYLFCWCVWL